jgi:hypothetical protein
MGEDKTTPGRKRWSEGYVQRHTPAFTLGCALSGVGPGSGLAIVSAVAHAHDGSAQAAAQRATVAGVWIRVPITRS